MLRAHLVAMGLFTLLFCIGCGDDDKPTASSTPVVAGTWILDSATSNGIADQVSVDTLIYRSNNTGHYGSAIGWGWYDFTYEVSHDSIFETRTDGQFAGSSDSCAFAIAGGQLILTDASDPSVIRVQFWSND